MNNRSEILFLYDVKWANPNGDPLDENKPRIDEETERCIVTDVRLKRTIRDEWLSWGETIWVSGEAVSPDKRREELKIEKKEDALKCLDVRLFGAVIPISKQADTSYTGPVQFRPGTSLHAVKVVFQQGTAAFTSQDQAQQRSFREEYLIPYALIAFYGVANETAAKITNATEEDLQKLLKAIWDGTKNLITRSKMEHNPRLLMRVVYKENVKYHIGELDSYLEIQSSVDEKSIRDISEIQLKIDKLLEKLDQSKDLIKRVELKQSDRLTVLKNNAPVKINEVLERMNIEVVNLP
ncbi:CRISPR-associated protein Csh2 [Pseudothermotoga hypogea DSM 11164 = NBRC 106472]|uniref:CRISPR-associated protein Csh2 n=1 Tax=Pseudothermotoga hypogea DSM 11164 = NBRC 106472 TaxID=1123384 RepID=A0A0X1KR88_9THEM|nr:type I-B CRISPR-associated protein Cas7/Csh2 [Pseudothermotoga hypogea]AJC73782.1 CRISPR-associated protein Csh2 [Pseudothermotoga hypogea DSM 11164 = NBRC 106472]